MTALTLPDPERHAELVAMLGEYADDFPHGSGIWNVPVRHQAAMGAPQVRSFARLLRHLADPASTYLDDTVPSWYFWLTDAPPEAPPDAGAGELVGFLAFRHRLSPWLLRHGGHIGYSVRPSRRREGHASRALGLAVRRAPQLGIDRLLVTCDEDNAASAGTIEANGGALEDIREGQRRYWIAV